MFGLDFLFAAGLWALPLAGLPILLHMLFRRKSPVVLFSTLRFVRSSMQRTAARRRIQRWLLLAMRALLIALLIWAISQPAKRMASGWSGTGRSMVATIVVDTSYSMLLQDGQTPLLNKANDIVQDLLRNELAGAKVAIFTSQMKKDAPEQVRDASAVLSDWSPLQPLPANRPLLDRIASAVDLLRHQPAEQKWLIVVSDFQAREFPRALASVDDAKVILLDLHQAEARSAGISRITITPEQPIPGILSEQIVEVTGHPGDSRAVSLKLTGADGTPISQTLPAMANIDASGRASVHLQLAMPGQRWLLLNAVLGAEDAMPWDNARSRLVEIPSRRNVAVVGSSNSPAEKFVRLALDPSEGKLTEWPLAVKKYPEVSAALADHPGALVAVLDHWPDGAAAASLLDAAKKGATLMLFLQPGMEDSWAALPAAQKSALQELLPAPPADRAPPVPFRAAVADLSAPLLQGMTDEKYQIGAINLRRIMPLTLSGNARAVLNAMPASAEGSPRPAGLLFRQSIGSGIIYTMAAVPDPNLTNMGTHPTFLPLLVRMALRPPSRSAAQNVEIGEPLVLDASLVGNQKQLQLDGPAGAVYRVSRDDSHSPGQFVFDGAAVPGLYSWRDVDGGAVLAMTNVQLPAAETDLTCRPAPSIAPKDGDVVIASNIAELRSKVTQMTQPQPRWSTPIAIVMFLLCLEALMGSVSKLWKPKSLKELIPGMAGAPTTATAR